MEWRRAPAQVVLSGTVPALERVERALAARGLGFTRLPVANAFHSPLVSSSAAPLRRYLDEVELARPAVDVYANTTASPYPADPDAIRETVARQLADGLHGIAPAGVEGVVSARPAGAPAQTSQVPHVSHFGFSPKCSQICRWRQRVESA